MKVEAEYFTTVRSEWDIPEPEEKDWEEMSRDEKREHFFRKVPNEPEDERVFYDANSLTRIN